jgi:GcrA cell cycle regulator
MVLSQEQTSQGQHRMSWTDERIEQLKQMWDKGMSASQIAEALAGGITRNAVIGKAHRLGLKARPSPVKSDSSKRAAPAPAVAEAALEVEATPRPVASAPVAAAPVVAAPAVLKKPKPAAPAKSAKVTLLDLTERICKWPIGHPGDDDFHFCGKPVQPGTPYCPEHCAVAYQTQLPRRDKRPGAMPPPRYRV